VLTPFALNFGDKFSPVKLSNIYWIEDILRDSCGCDGGLRQGIKKAPHRGGAFLKPSNATFSLFVKKSH
jgi:hypothetical protein